MKRVFLIAGFSIFLFSNLAFADNDLDSKVTRLQNQMHYLLSLSEKVDAIDESVSTKRGDLAEIKHAIAANTKSINDINVAITKLQKHLVSLQKQIKAVPLSKEAKVKILYKSAYGNLKNKHYDAATTQFLSLLKQYPHSAYVMNSHYWLAQMYLLKNLQTEAKTHLTAVVKLHPRGYKMPASMLALATIEKVNGNIVTAKHLLKRIKIEYRHTSYAKRANKMLATLHVKKEIHKKPKTHTKKKSA